MKTKLFLKIWLLTFDFEKFTFINKKSNQSQPSNTWLWVVSQSSHFFTRSPCNKDWSIFGALEFALFGRLAMLGFFSIYGFFFYNVDVCACVIISHCTKQLLFFDHLLFCFKLSIVTSWSTQAFNLIDISAKKNNQMFICNYLWDLSLTHFYVFRFSTCLAWSLPRSPAAWTSCCSPPTPSWSPTPSPSRGPNKRKLRDTTSMSKSTTISR